MARRLAAKPRVRIFCCPYCHQLMRPFMPSAPAWGLQVCSCRPKLLQLVYLEGWPASTLWQCWHGRDWGLHYLGMCG